MRKHVKEFCGLSRTRKKRLIFYVMDVGVVEYGKNQ